MQNFIVDGISFEFPDSHSVTKYDEWSYYRKHFISTRKSIKAVDLLVYADDTAYLVEVKDYRVHPRTKPSDLSDEIVDKVLDTLSAILPARCKSNNIQESGFARKFMRAKKIKVVLHLEQPKKHSRLFPRAIDPADIMQKLRQRLRSVDPHARVTESTRMHGVPWDIS